MRNTIEALLDCKVSCLRSPMHSNSMPAIKALGVVPAAVIGKYWNSWCLKVSSNKPRRKSLLWWCNSQLTGSSCESRRSKRIHRIEKGLNAAPLPTSQAWDSMPTLFTHPKIVFLDQERQDLNTLKNNAPTLLTMTAHHITILHCHHLHWHLKFVPVDLYCCFSGPTSHNKRETNELSEVYRSLIISYSVVL